jgi:hypothetical protein
VYTTSLGEASHGMAVACPVKLGASKTCIKFVGGLGRSLDGALRALFLLVRLVEHGLYEATSRLCNF